MKLVATLDNKNHPYVTGYLLCSQYKGFKHARFYLDTGCTCTTILDVDAVKLGLDWSCLTKSIHPSMTASGGVNPFELPNVIIGLQTFDDQGKRTLKQFPLRVLHIIPPDDPTAIVPVQYSFSYSLLGIDVLKRFNHWYWDYKKKKVILER